MLSASLLPICDAHRQSHTGLRAHAFTRRAIGFSLVVLGLTGFLSLHGYSPAPAGPLLEALLILLVFVNVRRIDRVFFLVAILVMLYVVRGAAMSIARGVHILDFLLAYKAFVYVLLLSFFVNKRIFDESFVRRLYLVVISMLAAKYVVVRVALGVAERPGLLAENNFELMLPLMLFISLTELRRGAMTWWGLVGLLTVFVLSGSRSGLAALAFVICILGLRRAGLKSIVYLAIGSVVAVVAVVVFLSRLGTLSVTDIDRVQFAIIFAQNIASWNLIEYLTGTPPVSALDTASCAQLAYYKELFSFAGDGRCYSVILHSFVLRVIFDHGLLGLFALLSWVWFALRVSGSPRPVALGVVGAFVLNGLSVSSLSSIFAAFPLAILLALDRPSNLSRLQGSGRAFFAMRRWARGRSHEAHSAGLGAATCGSR
jgi:hypothetical protein